MPLTPDVIITNTLEEFELAYGKNIVSLYDNNEASATFCLQIFDSGSASASFDLRQFPNISGYAHFDIANVLKSKLSYKGNLETIIRIATHTDEVYGHQVKAGWVNGFNGDTVLLQVSSSTRYVLPGRKDVTYIQWPSANLGYVPWLNSGSALGVDTLSVVQVQKALTDRHLVSVNGGNITDGKPSWVTSADTVWLIDKKRDDDYTLSFINDWYSVANGPPKYHNGIAGFRLAAYSGSTQLYDSTLTNTVSNGGGPNTDISGQSGSVAPQYKVLSVQVGNSSFPLETANLTATHVYVSAVGWGSGNFFSYSDLSNVYRINIEECDGRDFENYQVSWINSFGFRDYFHFTKRDDNVATVTRNTYKQLDANWAGANFFVNDYARGEKVYNQSLNEEYTINTRYLTDVEAAYLKNLYLSPDIRVRFPGQSDWVSVIPTTNQWTSRTFRKDKLFQYTLGFKLANPIQLQRG